MVAIPMMSETCVLYVNGVTMSRVTWKEKAMLQQEYQVLTVITFLSAGKT
jgi:hypothetical protein